MKTLLLPLTFVLTLTSLTMYAGDDEKAITECVNKEVKAFVQRDYDTWATCWVHEPYITKMSAGSFGMQLTKSWDSLSARTKKDFASMDSSLSIKKEGLAVHVTGNMAVVFADEKLSSLYAGENYDQAVKAVYTLKKDKGQWKFVSISTINSSSYENNDAITEWQINMAGYKLLWANKIDKAIKVFTLNTELFPEAFNTWDSLGEAHMKNGDKENAKKCYQKSLALNSQNTNAQKMLDKMQQEEED